MEIGNFDDHQDHPDIPDRPDRDAPESDYTDAVCTPPDSEAPDSYLSDDLPEDPDGTDHHEIEAAMPRTAAGMSQIYRDHVRVLGLDPSEVSESAAEELLSYVISSLRASANDARRAGDMGRADKLDAVVRSTTIEAADGLQRQAADAPLTSVTAAHQGLRWLADRFDTDTATMYDAVTGLGYPPDQAWDLLNWDKSPSFVQAIRQQVDRAFGANQTEGDQQ